MHHGQATLATPRAEESKLIWRETGSRLTDRETERPGNCFPVTSSEFNHVEIKVVNFASPRWENSVDQRSFIQIISVLGTLLRSQNIIQCYQERNVSAPGELAPVPLQWSMLSSEEDKVFLWRWREDVVMSSPPPDLGPFNQAEECTYIAIKHLNFLNIQSFSKWN